MELDTLLQRFDAEYLELHSISPGRRQQQAVFLRRLADSIDRPLTEVTAADVNAFIGSEIARGLHPNTGRKYVGMLKSFAQWGGQTGLLLHTSELQLVRNPRGSGAQNRPNPYTPPEIRALFAAITDHYPALPAYGPGSHALRRYVSGRSTGIRRHLWRYSRRLQLEAQVALALECGLRRIEIHSSPLAALHPENTHVVVLTAKQGPGREVRRAIPYPEHARQAMEEWLELRWQLGPEHGSPWLALPQTGPASEQVRPQTYDGFRGALALVGTWGWSRLRHTAATEWLRAGVPVEQVKEFMGHSSIEQTLAYAKIGHSDIERGMRSAEGEFRRRLGLS